jgi:NitT/TauT family transport system substrate-binding protein
MSVKRGTAFALLGLAAACGIVTLSLRRLETPSTSSVTTIPVTIAQAGDFYLYAPLYVAIDAGLFEQRGVKVSLITTGGDDKTWAAVLSGSAMFGVADPMFIAVSGQQGMPGKIVADLVNGVPFWGISKRDDLRSVDDFKRLQPLTVVTFPSPSTAYALQTQMFHEFNLAPHIREAAFGTLIAVMDAGQADIALELEPGVSQAEKIGIHIVYSMAKMYGEFAITGLTTTALTIERQHATVQKIVCGLQDGLDLIASRRDEALTILAKRFPDISKDVAAAALDRVIAEGIIPKSLQTSKKAWENAERLRRSVGDLREPASYQLYVDNTFANGVSSDCSK